jgi:hypothetical protein
MKSCKFLKPFNSIRSGMAYSAKMTVWFVYLCIFTIFFCFRPAYAANFVTYTVQASGQNWDAAIWTNLVTGGSLVSPTAGNSYEVLSGALIRPATTNSTPTSPIIFPGDSLQLDAGSSIRLKSSGGGATGYFVFNDQGGELILNGGSLDAGDDMLAVIYSAINVVTNTDTQINGGQDNTTPNSPTSGARQGFRNYLFYGGLSGSGNLTFANAVMYNNPQVTTTNFGTTNANFSFLANGAGYSGNITVTSGWLQAGAIGAFGSANITIAGGNSANGVNGPAQFDATIAFSDPGIITIQDTNSTFLLDTNMAFGGVIIDGNTLPNGDYTAGQINAITGHTNVVDPTGANVLSVGGGTVIAPVAPAIVSQTGSFTNYEGGIFQLLVVATGTSPLSFQWMAGPVGSGTYTNVEDGGTISGATNSFLTISNAVPFDQADYIVVITNSAGSVTSSVPTTVNLISLAINSVSPASEILYPGGRATFNVAAVGAPPLTYQWQKIVGDTTNEIVGATNSTLTINDVGTGDVASYDVVVTTPYATATGGPVSLTLTSAPTDAYGQDIMSLGPVAYWRLSEGSGTNAYDYAGGHTAIYGPDSYLQDPGPSGPGFPANNTSLSPENNDQSGNSSYATLSASDGLDLNTNTVTIVAWVNPTELIPNAGIVYQRDSSGTAGLGLTANGDLGYNWNNDANTYNWDSGLALPINNEWSLVVLTVTPTNATIYMYNASQQSSAVNAYPNAVAPLSGLLEIGSDPQNNEQRAFSGDLGEVAIYNRALSSAEIVNLYTVGAGTPVAPGISTQPQSQWVLPGHNVQFSVFATGSDPITYQWQKNTGSGPENITGATNSTLTISNVGPANVAGYSVEVMNPVTTVDSSVATLTLLPTPTGFETNVLNLGPFGYWPLNEISGTNAFDYSGDGFIGLYEPGVTLDTTGPNPPFTGIDNADNVAPLFTGATNSYVSLPSLNLTSANVTITAWIYPTVAKQNADAGLVFNRVNSANGLCFGDDGTNLNYGWNNDGGLWHYSSGLVPPENVWSFVALVVTPTNATFYLYNTNSQLTDVNVHDQSPATFSGETRIGDDNQGTREFQGKIAQVAIYDNSLTPNQVGKLYTSVGGTLPIVPSDANLTIGQQPGGVLQLNWSQGTLLEATNVTGPWVTNTATAPYTVPTTSPQMFYRIRLQ